ncbi:hypothetical protein K470DRAFT_124315 [Piedraia hortae CBS 480.64]|uniref:DDE-1 domain-containing protein n=1 Tax=Piedraia hortae CBS 480.64 TaxID=1314780 RepID=A0A6A7C8Q9_9PEZI|nr:hypothetical protein K470DRAFT_124315 [Piedraia hortae CBS 480.64]
MTGPMMSWAWTGWSICLTSIQMPRPGGGGACCLSTATGHISILEFLNFCDANKILIAFHSPHATHRLQHLDLGLFSPPRNYYSQWLNEFTSRSLGLPTMTKRSFFFFSFFLGGGDVFWKAFRVQSICSLWQKTGIFPWDAALVPDKLLGFQAYLIGRGEGPRGQDNAADTEQQCSSVWF